MAQSPRTLYHLTNRLVVLTRFRGESHPVPQPLARGAGRRVPDGSTVGFGGAGLQRKPMAAARTLAAAGRRDLIVVSFLGSLDVELLLTAGCIRTLHSAGVALDGAGLAPRYRVGRQEQTFEFVEWSEGTLLCALQATAAESHRSRRGWHSTPICRIERERPRDDRPVHGRAGHAGPGARADVAILHVPASTREATHTSRATSRSTERSPCRRAHLRLPRATVADDPRRAVLSRPGSMGWSTRRGEPGRPAVIRTTAADFEVGLTLGNRRRDRRHRLLTEPGR